MRSPDGVRIHAALEAIETAANPGLDRSQRLLQVLCKLAVRQPVAVRKDDGLALVAGELLQAFGQRTRVAARTEHYIGAGRVVRHRFYHVPASNTAVGHLVLEEAAA